MTNDADKPGLTGPEIPASPLVEGMPRAIVGARTSGAWRRPTALLLILGFALWVAGATGVVAGTPFEVPGPTIGEPLEPQLRPIAAAVGLTVYELSTIVMAGGVVLTAAGLAPLTLVLWARGERIMPATGLATFLVGVISWGPATYHRAHLGSTVLVRIAAVLGTWGDSLGVVNGVLPLASLVLFSLALVRTGLMPPWLGWATGTWSVVNLGIVLVLRGTGPIVIYVITLLIGVVLIVGRMAPESRRSGRPPLWPSRPSSAPS